MRQTQDPFEHLAKLQSLNKRFLRKFATVSLAADALGPWEQGPRAYTGWLLSPKMIAGIDDALIGSLSRSLSTRRTNNGTSPEQITGRVQIIDRRNWTCPVIGP
jgi:hypothetical protein